MDFELNEEQRLLKRNVREFLEGEIAPIADDLGREPLSYETAHALLGL